MTKILLGCDPELFMKNPNTGAFVSAHGSVPGSKHEPYKVINGAIQIDGTALEFNINPAATADEFVQNIVSVRNTISSYVPGYNVVAEPVAIYDEEYFHWDIPQTAKELGCDPDFNAWTLHVNPRPDPGRSPMRTAAGHIHVGWTEGQDVFDDKHFSLCAQMSRQMDYYLGIYSLIWDRDGTRRELYGKAGAFRPKPYGMEYRVLSNRWLSSEALMRWVYSQSLMAVRDAFDGRLAESVWGDTAMNIINTNMVDWENYYSIHFADVEQFRAA